ncbi:MAG: PDZ domain-containing protein [Gemmatimonadota bacterium]|nr:PDZ domain-containing protein [Gemmatimonadota bacterium]
MKTISSCSLLSLRATVRLAPRVVSISGIAVLAWCAGPVSAQQSRVASSGVALRASAVAATGSGTAAEAAGTRLLRRPSVSSSLITFEYGGDIWTVPRTGGAANRITATTSVESDPYFSPDGNWIAYTAMVAGNADVYVVPSIGGAPRRLTYDPGGDFVRGWTPDGRRVLFASSRATVPTPGVNSFFRLWTVSVDGGMPEAIPLPRAFTGSYSADGKQMAYQPLSVGLFAGAWSENQGSQWRRYRGGRTQPIHVVNLGNYSETTLPWTDSNDTGPMWVGNTVYFLSDRDRTVNLYSYDLDSKKLTQLTHYTDFDIMSASAGSGEITYEQAGYVHLLDMKSGQSHQVVVNVAGSFPWAQPQMKNVGNLIADGRLSPSGVRAVFEARGDIFTMSAKGSEYRNITHSSNAHERSPAWSPDGGQIAYLSDVSGEYQLMIGDQAGATKPRVIALPSHAFFSETNWSPDGRSMLIRDNYGNLWIVDVASGRFTKVDTDTYDTPGRSFEAVWSPDSKWLAYSKSLPNQMRSIFLYSTATSTTHRLGDGLADAISPAFDRDGKYLYFLASTDWALKSGWVDMSALGQSYSRSVYAVVLSASGASPVLPHSEEEAAKVQQARDSTAAAPTMVANAAVKPGEMRDTTKQMPRGGPPSASARAGAGASAFHIDLDGIDGRIVPLNIPPGVYASLSAGAPGTFYYAAAPSEARGGLQLYLYQVAAEQAVPILGGIQSYSLSQNGKMLLYRVGATWGIVSAEKPAKVGEGVLNTASMQTLVDPHAEWAEIFTEMWRLQREFFYDAKMHGNDWDAIYKKYEPMVRYVEHRDDLAYLMASVGGELTVGHSYTSGPGDVPDTEHESVGLLAADFKIENGRYRISRIYTNGQWNPQLHAPLDLPGLNVKVGDYLLEVNGQPLTSTVNLYSLFIGTAGRQTTLRVSSTPSTSASRDVTVVPVASDESMRTQAWVDANRQLVDKLSGGKLAYVWLPNTGGPGFTAFNRYYFAQQDKAGAIIDERFNQGGTVADYIIEQLSRPFMGYFAERAGRTYAMPMVGINGPKVMIINESAGSGGDAMPYFFKKAGVGPLVGTRTWGGLVGTIGVPATLDGGGMTAPDLAFYDVDSKWSIENEGIAPDIEVRNTAADMIGGHDRQLERAVQVALDALQRQPFKFVPRPPPINRVTGGSSSPQ